MLWLILGIQVETESKSWFDWIQLSVGVQTSFKWLINAPAHTRRLFSSLSDKIKGWKRNSFSVAIAS
jgi:hypothetical protein